VYRQGTDNCEETNASNRESHVQRYKAPQGIEVDNPGGLSPPSCPVSPWGLETVDEVEESNPDAEGLRTLDCTGKER